MQIYRQFKIILISVFILTDSILNVDATLSCADRAPLDMIQKIAHHFFERHNHFSSQKDVWGPYHLDLTFEALLTVDQISGETEYLKKIQHIMKKRNYQPSDTIDYRTQPFCNISFALFQATNDSDFIDPFLSETRKMLAEAGKSVEGAVGHKPDYPGRHLLIDYLQEYASRMAKAGWLSGDEAFFEECVNQFVLYKSILKNPETGLWSQGRGWLDDPAALSPGAWSRGHGWLIRGMVSSLDYLPPDSDYFRTIQEMLKELADALLKVQDENGMWHQLLNRPFDESYPESSGTGLIAYNLAKAHHKGYLDGYKYKHVALRAIRELYNYVGESGEIFGTCKGPGPLYSIKNYLRTSAEIDDPHGAPALIYAFAAEILLMQ